MKFSTESMPKQLVPYSETGYFSKLICDYIAQQPATQSFYHRFPVLENFKAQIEEKQKLFSDSQRSVLAQQLTRQYEGVAISEATQNNIQALRKDSTFTITTGHQLNLFTGPLYFLYKIFSVINLAEKLKEEHPSMNFVPVYWMATEDHDFDEINYFNLGGKKIAWDREDGGAVGELSTDGLEAVFEVFQNALGGSLNANALKTLFSEGYLKHATLTDATRYIANELFKEYGLVIIDGNDSELKKSFIPYAEKELTESLSHQQVTRTTARLIEAGFSEQVHPREINLFYLTEGIRERIIEKEGQFIVNNTQISFTPEGITAELKNHPERFSPNALLRPLYQEVVLPNLCYVGGGGELAYWFQLKDYFNSVEVPFPILLLRNSVLLTPKKMLLKLERLEVEVARLFQKPTNLAADFTKQLSKIDIDLTPQKNHLREQFKGMYDLAKKTDASFLGAVEAQEKKQIKGLNNLEKRLLKAQKRKLKDQLTRLALIQENLFPKGSLQERSVNFSNFYLEYGADLLSELKNNLDPLGQEFTIIEL